MSAVNHPEHYNHIPDIECIDVIEWFNFNIGSAIKYLWRVDFKGKPVEDLEKAAWYIQREIERRERMCPEQKKSHSMALFLVLNHWISGMDWLA